MFGKTNPKPFSDLLVAMMTTVAREFGRGTPVSLSTGFRDLDHKMHSFLPGNLILLAGAPGMGKTSLARAIALNVAKTGTAVGFLSLDESAPATALAMASLECSVPADQIRRGQIAKEAIHRFVFACEGMRDLPLLIDDRRVSSFAAIRRHAGQLKRGHGIALLIVDSLQRLMPFPADDAAERRETADLRIKLKALAMDLDIAVMVLTEISDRRGIETRPQPWHHASFPADLALYLHRRERYLAQSEPERRPDEDNEVFQLRYSAWWGLIAQSSGLAELMCSPRLGPTGTITLAYDGSMSKFSDFVGGVSDERPRE